ncbi:MAG: hypothetical protein HKM89_02060, partial [Gemmatimonadales bacterium]|nr:hypothetical protein [Gemmatimonadales bacterium]
MIRPSVRMLLLGASGGLLILAGQSCGSTEPQGRFEAGQISLTATTTGFDLDPDGYLISVDGQDPFRVAANAAVVLNSVTIGGHTIRISD